MYLQYTDEIYIRVRQEYVLQGVFCPKQQYVCQRERNTKQNIYISPEYDIVKQNMHIPGSHQDKRNM